MDTITIKASLRSEGFEFCITFDRQHNVALCWDGQKVNGEEKSLKNKREVDMFVTFFTFAAGSKLLLHELDSIYEAKYSLWRVQQRQNEHKWRKTI